MKCNICEKEKAKYYTQNLNITGLYEVKTEEEINSWESLDEEKEYYCEECAKNEGLI